MKHIKNLLLLTLLFVTALPALARKWSVDNLEMVYLKDSTQYVCNPDGVMGDSARVATNRILRRLEVDKDVQTVVVVVKHLEGDDPFTFGMDLSRKYGIGNKQNTGLIIILATEDRSYQILTGRGLEGTLPDAICRRVQDRIMVPQLKKGDWDAAILETVRALDQVVRGDSTIVGDNDSDDDDLLSVLILLTFMIVGAVFIGIVVAMAARKKCPKCGKSKHVRMVKSVTVGRKKTTTWHCKKCNHTFQTTEIVDNDSLSGGAGAGPIIIGGGHRRSGGFGGGGFGGGSFGGGSFGGGGSGGRFKSLKPIFI